MNRNDVGKIASAVVAAAVPALGALVVRKGTEMAVNQFKAKSQNSSQKKNIEVRRKQVSSAPVALSYDQPKIGFKTAAPTRKGASARVVGIDYVGPYATNAVANTYGDYVFEVYPNNSTLFTRLGTIALAYELFAFNKCRLRAVGVAASTLPGSMTVAPDMYPNGSGFTAAGIRNQEGQVTKKFWETAACDYDCSRATRPWFLVDPSGTASDTDSKLGDFHLGLDGTATPSTVVCDLFVEYDIEFAQCVAADGVSLLARSPLAHRIRKFQHGKEAIAASLRALLPAEERKDYDLDGNRVEHAKEVETSDSIERLLASSTDYSRSSSSPQTIPAAALKARTFN